MFAIDAVQLSKAYRVGVRESRPETLVGAVAGLVSAPARNLRRLRSLTRFHDDSAEADVVWALDNVTFQLEEGRVLGIIGRNGAGKSTLLKVLAGITEPTKGRAAVRGRVASLLEVGTGFHPDLTGRENVYLNGTILGMSRREVAHKFDEIVAFAEVERHIDTPIKWYSSGMSVRLAFSVAAHLEADILLVDEVLAVGDATFQSKCLGQMENLASAGRTVLFVSHNLGAIVNLCPETIWIEDGKIVQRGQSEVIVANYLQGARAGSDRDLRDAPRRKSSGAPLMQRARLTGDGPAPGTVTSGGSLEVEVDLAYEPERMPIASLVLQIRDERGYNVFGSTSGHYDVRVRNGTGTDCIRARLENLPLAPGSYSISLALTNGFADYEVIPDAIGFQVTWSRHEGIAAAPKKTWGPVFVPVQWEIVSRDSSLGNPVDDP